MLYPRIIPTLLIRDKGLVKTVGFKDGKYVGDPINAVKIFNEKTVDEIMVVDIDASRKGNEPDFKLIANLAAECRMPLCYGGGIKRARQAKEIVSLGVEKIAISSAAIEDPDLIARMADEVGSQSVVVVLDVKKGWGKGNYSVFTHNGTRKTGHKLIDAISDAQQRGAGEIVVNSIDRDGQMKGYDQELARIVVEATGIPVTILGGAGNLDDMGQLISQFGTIGVAAGSMFVFKGKYKAVLINYPRLAEREELITKCMNV